LRTTEMVRRCRLEIWRKNETEVTKVFSTEQKRSSEVSCGIPNRETGADIDWRRQHYWPREILAAASEVQAIRVAHVRSFGRQTPNE